MAYGKIRLSAKDREFIGGILAKRREMVGEKVGVATQDAEKQFYIEVMAEYAELRDKILDNARAKVAFSEEELKTLRGALFGAEKPEVMKAYREALAAGDKAAADTALTVATHLEKLVPLLEKPFLMDRSQDAEEEEDENEEDADGTPEQ
jgi:hypothetical protein